MEKSLEQIKLENRLRRLDGRPQNLKSPGVRNKILRKLQKLMASKICEF